MGFLDSLFEKTKDFSENTLSKRDEYAEKYARMSNYQLQSEYEALRRDGRFHGSFSDVLARTDAFKKECRARGFDWFDKTE